VTATGIPFAWVNLRHGVRAGETAETNTAACGSLVLELGQLSRLTGDTRFEVRTSTIHLPPSFQQTWC
jgi:mannosidase alpha-like ER degradation enhancer 1